MKCNFLFFSFLFFPLPWEKVQREEPKCKCNPTSTAVGDRYVGYNCPYQDNLWIFNMQPSCSQIIPISTYKTPAVPLLFIWTISTNCSNLLLKQTCYILFCTSEHLSCTMSSLDNEEIKGWNSSSLIPGFGKVWRDIYTSVTAPGKNGYWLYKLERHLFTKPKFWLSKFQRKNGLLQYFNYGLD